MIRSCAWTLERGDWTEESLNNTVEYFFSGSPLAVEIEEEIRSVYSSQWRLGGGKGGGGEGNGREGKKGRGRGRRKGERGERGGGRLRKE